MTVIPGDGVGPEIVRSAMRIIEAAGVPIAWEEAEAGAEVFRRGDSSGVPQATRESIERTRVVLKGPLETPVGFGEKSANVTLRKLFETYANIRPARELPGVRTPYTGEGASTSSSCGRTWRTCTRESSTWRRRTSHRASSSSRARAPRRSSGTRSSWRAARAARR